MFNNATIKALLLSMVLALQGCGGANNLEGSITAKPETILDIWGEGRIESHGLVTGFKNVDNLNHINQTISNGTNAFQPIPNLIPVSDYDNPQFPLDDDSYSFLTLMGAPITPGTAEEMFRVLKEGGHIYLYEADQSMIDTLESTASRLEIGLTLNTAFVTPTRLISPFNEIKMTDVMTYVHIYTITTNPEL